MKIECTGTIYPQFQGMPQLNIALNSAQQTLHLMISTLERFFTVKVKSVTFTPKESGKWGCFSANAIIKYADRKEEGAPAFKRSASYIAGQSKRAFVSSVFPAKYDIFTPAEEKAGELTFKRLSDD